MENIIFEEIGATGTYISKQGFLAFSDYNVKLQPPQLYQVVDEMRRSDGVVKAILNSIMLPILSAEWSVIPASDAEEDKIISDFVYENLFVKNNWNTFLRQALLYVVFGNMIFEKVWCLENGKVCLKKLSPRLPKTIQRYNIDEDNNLVSFTQYAYKAGNYQIVDIPREKCIFFVNEIEGENYEGVSILRSAYRAWFLKTHIYNMLAVGIERNAVGLPVVKLKDGATREDKELAFRIVKNIRYAEDMGVVLSPQMELEIVEGKLKGDDIYKAIQMCNEEIVLSTLCEFLLLGQTRGSYALGEAKINFFLLNLESIAKYIEEKVNSEIVKQLVEYNFITNKYPTVDCADISKGMNIEILTNMIKSLVQANVIRSDTRLEAYVRDILGLPEAQQEVMQTLSENNVVKLHQKKIKIGKKDKEIRRELKLAEQKVKFSEINDKIDEARDELYEKLEKISEKQINKLVKDAKKKIEQKDIDGLLAVAVGYQGEYKEALKNAMIDIINYGLSSASEEIGKKAVPITRWARKWADIKAEIAIDNAVSNYREKLVSTVVDGLNKKLTAREIIDNVRDNIKEWATRNIELTGEIAIIEGLNMGRDIVAQEYGIEVAMYSAILDDRVCSFCEKADGKYVRLDDPLYEKYTPPAVHKMLVGERNNACRCIWVYLTTDEIDWHEYEENHISKVVF